MTIPDRLTTMGSQTLSQRLTQGRLPFDEALRYAMMLAETLRNLHDTGQIHGAVSPDRIVLADSNVELSPAVPADEITPYSAPEVVSGRPVEPVSDIFSYGAVLYEMLTGRVAFEGATPAALAMNIVNSQPVSTGSPAADRLLASCLAKDPASRSQRMHKVILELKLLAVAARKARAAARRYSLEAKQQNTVQALNLVETQVASFSEHLAAVNERSSRAEQDIQSLNDQVGSRLIPKLESLAERFTQFEQSLSSIADRLGSLEQNVAALGDRVAKANTEAAERFTQVEGAVSSIRDRLMRVDGQVPPIVSRLQQLEARVETANQQASEARDRVAADIVQLETQLKEHAAALESSRTAGAQTDDLVEGVIEMLESLQSSVLEQSEGGASGLD
ncbi:MAG: protein kinase [Bryobacteraceae bacterium]